VFYDWVFTVEFPWWFVAVSVWLEYAKFAVERMSVMSEGMEFPRDVFERGIIACGLHVSEVGI